MTSVADTAAPSEHPRHDAHRRRRHPWRWIVAIIVVIVVLVVAWFVAEAVARGAVENDIRQRISTALAIPSDAEVDVDVAGAVLPQLIAGTLDDVTVTSDDVPIGSASGAVTMQASGVPVRGDGDIASATAQVVLDSDDVTSLLGAESGVTDVTLAAPNLSATVPVSVGGNDVQAVVTLAPSVSDGDLVLTPQSFLVDDETFSIEQVRALLGSSGSEYTDPRTVCIKKDIPAGLTLSSFAVADSDLTADFAVAGGILQDASLQKKGTCSS